MALEYSFKDQSKDKKPVLFILLKGNQHGIGSVMMNGKAYSSYPSEGEMLLMEGMEVKILGLEERVKLNNKHENLKLFFKKLLMVVYLYM